MSEASTRSLRLLYVIDSLGHGGAEQSLVAMLPEYRQRGVATVVVTLVARKTDLIRRAERDGARVIQAPESGLLGQAAWLHRAIAALRPDLVHSTLFRADLVSRAASFGTHVPVLTSLVNTQYEPERRRESDIPGWKLRIAQEIERWGGRLGTDHFHVNSEAVRTAAVNHLGVSEQSITLIHRGRDPEQFRPASEQQRQALRGQLGLPPEAALVLTVGRQEPQKGQRYLIEAFKGVVQAHPDARLAIVGGSGAASKGLQRQVQELELSDKIFMLGRRDDVPSLLGAADVFVLASLWEGLPNVILEAMATGLPVVASDIPPVREAVDPGRSALLARPADPESLAEAILKVLDDPGVGQALGERGRTVFLERFTIGPIADQMVGLYRNLAQSRQ